MAVISYHPTQITQLRDTINQRINDLNHARATLHHTRTALTTNPNDPNTSGLTHRLDNIHHTLTTLDATLTSAATTTNTFLTRATLIDTARTTNYANLLTQLINRLRPPTTTPRPQPRLTGIQQLLSTLTQPPYTRAVHGVAFGLLTTTRRLTNHTLTSVHATVTPTIRDHITTHLQHARNLLTHTWRTITNTFTNAWRSAWTTYNNITNQLRDVVRHAGTSSVNLVRTIPKHAHSLLTGAELYLDYLEASRGTFGPGTLALAKARTVYFAKKLAHAPVSHQLRGKLGGLTRWTDVKHLTSAHHLSSPLTIVSVGISATKGTLDFRHDYNQYGGSDARTYEAGVDGVLSTAFSVVPFGSLTYEGSRYLTEKAYNFADSHLHIASGSFDREYERRFGTTEITSERADEMIARYSGAGGFFRANWDTAVSLGERFSPARIISAPSVFGPRLGGGLFR